MYHRKTEKKKQNPAISASLSSFFLYIPHTHTHINFSVFTVPVYSKFIQITEINAEISCEITQNIKM